MIQNENLTKYPSKENRLSDYTQHYSGVEHLATDIEAGREIRIKHVEPVRPAGLIWCGMISTNIHVCRAETCRHYPCKVNP